MGGGEQQPNHRTNTECFDEFVEQNHRHAYTKSQNICPLSSRRGIGARRWTFSRLIVTRTNTHLQVQFFRLSSMLENQYVCTDAMINFGCEAIAMGLFFSTTDTYNLDATGQVDSLRRSPHQGFVCWSRSCSVTRRGVRDTALGVTCWVYPRSVFLVPIWCWGFPSPLFGGGEGGGEDA